MISKHWNQFPLDVPGDGQLIWCRVDRWSGAPFAGRYSSADGTITSLINGITYPQWAISAWRNSDPPIDLPPYPIGPIRDPNTSSAIIGYEGTSINWRIQWLKLVPNQDAENYICYYAIKYANGTGPNPSPDEFTKPKWFKCGNAVSPDRFWFFGQNTTAVLRYDVQNWIPQPERIVIPNFRMFVRYQLLHIPTGYFWPPIIESVQVT